MGRLDGRHAIVTGGSRGIGRGIAEALAREGAGVTICGRDEAAVRSAVAAMKQAGLNVQGIAADVSRPEDVKALADLALARSGSVDILVNNAGLGTFRPVAEMSVEEFDTMWSVNMRGVFLATRAVLPSMIAQKRGDIVNIASLAGKNTFKGGAGYAATKWALRGFSGCLMLEVREHNIRVVTVCPGSVDTAFSSTGKKGENIPQSSDVADAVVFAVTAPARAMFSEIDLRPTRP
jgi:NAD(P)-dependent dehydrogenase (short-subunit alcohol dehydrogenase family)